MTPNKPLECQRPPRLAALQGRRYRVGLLTELMVEKLVEYEYPNFVVTTCFH